MGNNSKLEQRKRLALQAYDKATIEARRVLDVIIKHPNFGDPMIAAILKRRASDVGKVRRRFNIPALGCISQRDMPEDFEKWPGWCEEDNKRLDEGVCAVNLHGNELKRYLDIKSCKERRMSYFHKRGLWNV